MEEEESYNVQETDDPSAWSDRLPVSQLCRICANPNDFLISIFEGEGSDHELGMKINKHLPIQVCEDDELPKHICYQCASTLIAWHDMVITCISADNRIRQLYKLEQEESTKNDDQSAEFFDDAADQNTQAEDECIEQTSSDRLHPISQDETKLKKVPTSRRANVGKERKSKRNTEMKISQSGLTFPGTTSKTVPGVEIANQKKDTPEQVAAAERWHPLSQTSLKSIQVECSKLLFSKSRIITSRSVSKFKEENEIPSTDLGREDSVSDVDIKEESAVWNEEEEEEEEDEDSDALGERAVYECEYCGKKLTTRENMKTHWRIHTGECPYTCHVCGKCFRVPSGIKRHLREVHDRVKDQCCELCGRRFANKRTLEDHMRTHTGERPFLCDSCDKTFKTKASLYIHKKSHTDVFPFKCACCERKFRVQSKLTLHLLQHTGEKPHKCDICGKGFRVKYELGKHKLVHSTSKPFSCTICGHRFRQERYLRNHKKNTHDKYSEGLNSDD
ncbi:zinc finger protein 155 isoform X3 [Anabrus simplex]|uniref:zinc finger protein 155 isoform X3 n=1 Tax=Anabrus simplex TaxID=316456 RepID=UPI0035A269B6